jgi:hypothetical protein
VIIAVAALSACLRLLSVSAAVSCPSTVFSRCHWFNTEDMSHGQRDADARRREGDETRAISHREDDRIIV